MNDHYKGSTNYFKVRMSKIWAIPILLPKINRINCKFIEGFYQIILFENKTNQNEMNDHFVVFYWQNTDWYLL